MLEPDAYTSPEDDPILAELWRIREEQAAEYTYDIRRQMEDSRRLQFLQGNDVVARSKSGRCEVVFKGTGKVSLDCDEGPAIEPMAAASRGSQDG